MPPSKVPKVTKVSSIQGLIFPSHKPPQTILHCPSWIKETWNCNRFNALVHNARGDNAFTHENLRLGWETLCDQTLSSNRKAEFNQTEVQTFIAQCMSAIMEKNRWHKRKVQVAPKDIELWARAVLPPIVPLNQTNYASIARKLGEKVEDHELDRDLVDAVVREIIRKRKDLVTLTATRIRKKLETDEKKLWDQSEKYWSSQQLN